MVHSFLLHTPDWCWLIDSWHWFPLPSDFSVWSHQVANLHLWPNDSFWSDILLQWSNNYYTLTAGVRSGWVRPSRVVPGWVRQGRGRERIGREQIKDRWPRTNDRNLSCSSYLLIAATWGDIRNIKRIGLARWSYSAPDWYCFRNWWYFGVPGHYYVLLERSQAVSLVPILSIQSNYCTRGTTSRVWDDYTILWLY